MKKLIDFFKGRIRARLFVVILLILVFVIGIISVLSSPILFRAFTGSTYRDLCSVADAVEHSAPDTGSYYFDLYAIYAKYNVEFEIVNADGYVTYTTRDSSSALGSGHFGNGSTSSEFSDLRNINKYSLSSRYRNFSIMRKVGSNAEYFVYKRELSTDETVYIYYSVADVQKIVGIAEKIYIGFSLAIIAVLGTAFSLLISGITKPVVEINDVTKDMAALDFRRKCADYGKDEIGELGRSINVLSDSLDTTLKDLKDKNSQLEKDIEMQMAVDRSRKSFISNVSHELKTPISIISGYAEGLCEGIGSSPEMIKEYCSIIRDESEKMNSLVVELLELSKLESQSVQFKPSYFDIGVIVESIASHLLLQIEEKGIRFVNNVPKGTNCYAESDKIETVLRNYITNAISHCAGDKSISIDMSDSGDTYQFSVFNTGENISDEDISEIWDSFYRADKSHERKENRFGLGLSIVKTIMLRHRCSCDVKNTEDGVLFSFEVAKDADFYEDNQQ